MSDPRASELPHIPPAITACLPRMTQIESRHKEKGGVTFYAPLSGFGSGGREVRVSAGRRKGKG